ncbi:caspase family protein [Nitrosomonas communis]|uniref:N-acetylmuramoyl-L-alanine amidase n=1 Tax=Nitrosomonas communis TaxID=44574 RepID=A0A1I4RDM2_9PROT|nr:caspase family protein [Nitrosomonas communis]SFM50371.1 N-acetylmuramoyl-L-alanine amidase [Nitrosomonas communis]
MPVPFKQLTCEEYAVLLDKFPFTRKINAVHMHHTWKPDHAQYKGHETIVGMWRYHTETKGWQDIAQHITIAPDGSIWLGRNWNSPPVSAKGHNGNLIAGPLMFGIIGNFDYGNDKLEGEQLKTTLEVIARVQKKFQLAPESLVFHNAMSTKTCPGNSINFADIVSRVRELHSSLGKARVFARDLSDAPFVESALEISQVIKEALDSLSRVPTGEEPADAELSHDEAEARAVLQTTSEATRGPSGLTPVMLEMLRPHLVNLNMGEFSSEGEWKTTRGDIDAIFEEHLPKALDKTQLMKLPIMFFAHGGLVKESAGLKIAQKHIDWWLQNGIYPIYFIWETGAFETIAQLLRRAREGAIRALPRDAFDHTTDLLIEETVRALQGPRIWSGMKLSAQLASSSNAGSEGGAWYVAEKISQFCNAHKDKVELHAVGHSAGSIFHCYFIPAALDLEVPYFKSVHFLAPAVRVDTFKAKLADRIGKGINQLSIFTMNKSFEQNDNCAMVYRKSLLYLIYSALEAERKAPILGLEESIRSDSELKKLFGLGIPNASGEVIWSVSLSTQGRNASTSQTHGGFDDDGPTMGSVARRILGKSDADSIFEYITEQSGMRKAELWNDQVDWPEQIQLASAPDIVVKPLSTSSMTPSTTSIITKETGRYRALCVGINRYPTAPLFGCVADAQAWANAFKRMGFEEPLLLLDEKASRANIIERLTSLVTSSRPGDVIVFQYAGHGTQLPDVNRDELGGDSANEDEAICPYDFAGGAFLIDDDIGEIFNQLPSGVNLTCFIDCCHSGTISRFAVGTTPGANVADADERPRFIVASDELKQAHRHFRQNLNRRRSLTSGGPSLMREVVFSACLSSEVAWESDGHGEFTVRALRVLQFGMDGLSNEQFEQRVTAEFGSTPRQHARLYCAPSAKALHLLQPLSIFNR